MGFPCKNGCRITKEGHILSVDEDKEMVEELSNKNRKFFNIQDHD